AWVLHRPRTLKPDQAAMAAPPIIVFDPAGNFIKAWGGVGRGYEWVEREHGIHIDHKGFVWLGGNYCAGMNLPGLKPVADDQLLKFTQDGKLMMQIGGSIQSKGNSDTKNGHRAADVWSIRRPTTHPAPPFPVITGSSSPRRIPARSSGCGAPSPTSQWMTMIVRSLTQRASPMVRVRRISAPYTPSAWPTTGWCTWPIEKTGASRCSRMTASS